MSLQNSQLASVSNIINGQYQHFGELLKAIRKHFGLTAAQLAEQLKIHTNSQSNYENNKREPNIDYIIQLSALLNISFWHLLSRRVELSENNSADIQGIMNDLGPFYKHLGYNSAHYSDNQISENQQQQQSIIDSCFNLIKKFKHQREIIVLTQQGDSMSPTLKDGDQLFVDTNNQALIEGEIFVFKFADLYSAKRVQLLPNNELMLVTDNNSFHPVKMNRNKLNKENIIGKLISSINSHQ